MISLRLHLPHISPVRTMISPRLSSYSSGISSRKTCARYTRDAREILGRYRG